MTAASSLADDLRARFRRVLEYQPVDRIPALEEGLRDDVLERWSAQGMPPGGPAAVFHYDRRERLELDLGLRPPKSRGLVTGSELDAWQTSLDRPLESRLGPAWDERVRAWKDRRHLLELHIHSGIMLTMGVGDGASLEAFIYMLADEPEAVLRAMTLQGELARRLTRRVLEDVELDMISFSEPIGDNHGPLLGPRTFRTFALDTYRPILDLARNIPARVFMTYANARCLMPEIIASGFNVLWAMETETTAMDYRRLREEFGRDLRFIGGIDLDALLSGDRAIDAELRRKIPELLAMGGCLPLADGRVRSSVDWPGYVHYRKLLEQMLQADWKSEPRP